MLRKRRLVKLHKSHSSKRDETVAISGAADRERKQETPRVLRNEVIDRIEKNLIRTTGL